MNRLVICFLCISFCSLLLVNNDIYPGYHMCVFQSALRGHVHIHVATHNVDVMNRRYEWVSGFSC